MPGKVKVKIVAGRNLPVMDRASDNTDAYVEIKLGNTTYKTEVCRKSLNPQWNSEWYRFEVDDSELQDEPLQIRLMDYDTYSANDAIGKVYLDLNPLLLPVIPGPIKNVWTNENTSVPTASTLGGSVMSGWIPVYDTMHGIRGEVNVIVKVEFFSDFNKFRQSSCGVQFFCSRMIPQCYHAQIIHGFVEELVVNDDPEYQWIDKIRTPRASNEARQTLFLKLSGELQRKIGLKALDLGGNAVIGYQQCFDLEGESGIVVRGIGTAVTLVRLQETVASAHQPVDSSVTCDDSGMLPDSVLDVGVAAGMPLVSRCFLPSLSPMLCVTPPTPHDSSPANNILSLGFSPTRVGPNFPGVKKMQKLKKGRKRQPVVVVPHYLAVESTLEIPPTEQRICREPQRNRMSSQPAVDFRQLLGCKKLGRSTQSLRSSIVSEDLALRNLLLQEDMRGEGRRGSMIVKGLKAIKLLPKPKISKTLNALKIKLQSDVSGDESDVESGGLVSVISPSKYFGRAAELSKAKVKLWKQHSRSSSESVATTLIRSLMDSNNTGLDSVAEVRESPGSSPTSPSKSEAMTGGKVTGESFRLSVAKREHPSVSKKRPASMSVDGSVIEAAFVSRPTLNISFTDTYLSFSCEQDAPQLQYVDGHLIPNNPLGLSSTSESSSSDDETSEDLSLDIACKERTPSYHPSPSPSVGYFASDTHASSKHPIIGKLTETASGSALTNTILIEECHQKEWSRNYDSSNKAMNDLKNSADVSTSLNTDIPLIDASPDSPSVKDKYHSVAIMNCPSQNISINSQVQVSLNKFTTKNSEDERCSKTPSNSDIYKAEKNMNHVTIHSALMTSGQEKDVAQTLVQSLPDRVSLPCEFICTESENIHISTQNLQENVQSKPVIHQKNVDPDLSSSTASVVSKHSPLPDFTAPSSACNVDVVFDVGGKSSPCRPAADVQKSRSEGSLHGCGGEAGEGDLPLMQHRNAEHGPCFIPASRQTTVVWEEVIPEKLPGSPAAATHSSSVGHKTSPSSAKLGNVASNAIHRRSSDSDLSITPKGNSLTSSDRSSTAGTHHRQTPTVVRPPMNQESLEMLEYPFLTMHKFPPGFILHLGGVVSSRSVKLLERITNLEDPETRDAWWTEIRMEVRSHARALGCNVVLGYSEHTSICDDVCVLSASGTAAVISLDPDGRSGGGGGGMSTPHPPPWVHAHTRELMTTSLDRQEFSDKSDSKNITPQKADGPVAVTGSSKVKSSPCDVFDCEVPSCAMCHIPYSESSIPFRVNMLKCAICRHGKVPDVLFTTIEAPEGIPTIGVGCLLQAYVCRPKPYCKAELNAKEISDGLPFLEYELHRLLINKLKVKGMNAIFGLKVQVQVGERMMIGLATGTAVFLCPLPAPPVPKISAGNSWTDEKKLTEIQKRLLDTVKKNRDVYQLKPITEVEIQSNGKAAPSDTDDSDDELPELDLAAGNKDTCVLEVDDAEDVDVVSLLMDPAPPDGFYAVNVETVPGLDDLEIVRNLQMFMQVWRAKIQPGQHTSNFSEHFHRVLQAVYFKLRRMVPCALCNLQFSVELPEPDELQLSVLGMALGLGELQTVHSSFHKKLVLQSAGKEPAKKMDDSEMIFKLDDDHPPSLSSSGEVSTPAAPLPPLLSRPRPRSPQRVRPLQPLAKLQHTPPRGGRYGVDITPLCYIPGGKIERYLGNLNFFFIRESTGIRECGGLSGFVHSFVTEVLAIVRAHVTALGGNAMVAYFISECILYHSPHKNQGQCLVNVGGDVVHVSYFTEDY